MAPVTSCPENFSGKKKLALDLVGSISPIDCALYDMADKSISAISLQREVFYFSLWLLPVLWQRLPIRTARLGKLFSWRPFTFGWVLVHMGIYLWHYPVIVLTSPVVDTGGFNISRALIQIVLSIALAALSKYIIEDPVFAMAGV